MALYNGLPVVPVEWVCRDFFSHLSPAQFIRKCSAGELRLPMVRIDGSQKCAKGIHIQDLAEYIDKRRDAAFKELQQMTRA